MQWFVRKGVFYRPVSLAGWVFLMAAILYLLWAFADIDGRSHSASDTLVNWLVQVLIVGLIYTFLGYFTEKR